MPENPLIRSLARQADGERQERSRIWRIPKLFSNGEDSRGFLQEQDGLEIVLPGPDYYAVRLSRQWFVNIIAERYVGLYFEGFLRMEYDEEYPVLIRHEPTPR